MKLKGIVKDDIEGYVEIVDVIIKPTLANYAVHMYYEEAGRKIYVTLDGKITARYTYPWDGTADIYTYGYIKLQTEDRFKDFIIVE